MTPVKNFKDRMFRIIFQSLYTGVKIAKGGKIILGIFFQTIIYWIMFYEVY